NVVDFGNARMERANKFAIATLSVLSIRHQAEKPFTEFVVPDRVEQNRTVFEAGNDGMGRGLQNIFRFVSRRDFYRQRIVFSWTVKITDFQKPKLGGVRSGRNRRAFEHSELPQRSRLRAKPATSRDILRQDYVFEAGTFAVIEQ